MTEKRLGPYRLIRLLGRGGMAEVYLATTEAVGGFRKRLALKLLLPRFAADKELVALLADEARVSVWLNHPQIVQVLDFGRDGPSYYLALEYVDGCDLRALVRHARGSSEARGRALPLPTALFVGLRVLEALDHAHRRCDPRGRPLAIIHRDVSPHNILVSRAGEVKLADFGLARAAVSLHQTQSGIVRGKFAFMPPEQAQAQAIDQRIDLFAVGVTLYQVLTGLKPYTSVTLAQQLYQLARPLAPPSTHLPGLPAEIDALTMRALALRADDRYPSAAAMAEDVARALERHGGGADEQRRLAALVSSAAPPSAEPEGALPDLSIADVKVPQQSLIGDAIVAAQHTLAAEPARGSPAPLASGAAGARTGAGERAGPGVRRQAAPGPGERRQAAPEGSAAVPARPAAPGRASTEEDLRALEASGSRPRLDPGPGPLDSRQIDAVHGVIDRPQPRRRAAAEVSRPPEPLPTGTAAPGARLVQALRQAREGRGGRRRRERRGGSVSWSRPQASPVREARPSAAHDETQLVRRRPARAGQRALLLLGGATLVVAGLALGWLLRDTLDQPAALPPGFPSAAAWPTTTPAPALALPPQRPSSDPPPPARAPEGVGLDETLPPPPPEADPSPAGRARGQLAPERRGEASARLGLVARRRARAGTHAAVAPPADEPATASPPAAGQGRLRVSSERPAQLFVDDEAAGSAPARLTLPPGIHRVRLVYDDQSTSPVQWVAIEAGQEASLAF